jgi:hypothetical protein
LDVPLKIGPSAEQCYSDIAHGDAVSSCPEESGKQHSTNQEIQYYEPENKTFNAPYQRQDKSKLKRKEKKRVTMAKLGIWESKLLILVSAKHSMNHLILTHGLLGNI